MSGCGATRFGPGKESNAPEVFCGRELEAITLHTPAALEARGRTEALTENFLPVELIGRLEPNRSVRVRVSGLTPEGALEAVPASNLL